MHKTVSLIICTYMRPKPLKRLLDSVLLQTKIPDEVLIIDGSSNDATKLMLESSYELGETSYEFRVMSSELDEGSYELGVQSSESDGAPLKSSFPSGRLGWEETSSEFRVQSSELDEGSYELGVQSSESDGATIKSSFPSGRLGWDETSSALIYHKVPPQHRGLTKQRNYGIARVHKEMDIVAFLDDDTILTPHYFENLLATYEQFPQAVGVGGYITNEVAWENTAQENPADLNYFYYDGYRRKESSRYKLRRKLGLAQETQPAIYPAYGHGRSISFLPPSGKIYQVEQLMGGVSSFPVAILKHYKFSEFFEGYGLYEDADFTLRLSKIGSLYVNTAAQLEHHHDAAGRPNKYNYGKMVVRNGWYVWRVKHPNPAIKDKIKWYQITVLLTAIRFLNIFTTNKPKEAFTEFLGRVAGLCGLVFNKPK